MSYFKYNKKNKYGNKISSSSDGRSFQSGLERKLYEELLLREKVGEIKDLKCQVSVYLTDAKILYKPDFYCFDFKRNCEIWIESKGFDTAVWAIKKRLWKFYGPGILQIYRGNKKGVFLQEEIKND